MTCVDVMYQPYTPYFPYQRPGPSVTGPFDHLKKYGAPRLENVASYLCSSPPITATATATVTATVTKTENEEETTDSPTPSSPTPIHTKYLSSNCAVVTYFNGDSATAVDEHFSRALSPPTSAAIYGNPAASTGDTAAMKTSWKDSSPMTQRNFPPSFWNSSYQPPAASLATPSFPGMSRQDLNPFAAASDPYNHMTSSLHMSAAASMHQDPWRGYPLTSQPAYPHHSELTYPSLTHARFSQHYSSLLPTTATRLGSLASQCGTDPSLVKHSDSWSGRYHAVAAAAAAADTLGSMAAAHHDSHLHSAAFTAATSATGQDSSKDMYWF